MQTAPLLASETWIIIIAALLEALVHTGVIPATAQTAINAVVVASLPVLFQTIFRKVRTGVAPFTQPSPK